VLNQGESGPAAILLPESEQGDIDYLRRKWHLPGLSDTGVLRAGSLVVGDYRRAKGLEFRCVVVVDTRSIMGVHSGEMWRLALKLYVAMTRATDTLAVFTRSGSPAASLLCQ